MHAEIIFRRGHVLTSQGRTATSVAVAKERIVAVGNEELDDLIGPATEVIELGDRLLLPGFQDAHVHPIFAATEMMQCDLTGLKTAKDTVEAVRTYAEAHPDLEWIQGGGWSMEAFTGGMPTKDLLDGVVGDRPVYLVNRDHHGGWANSRALALAGIDRHTPDPVGGRIDRDADGEPNGSLQEDAMELVGRLTPPSTAADRLAALLLAQRHLHALGVTAWQDAIVGDYLGSGDISDAYATAARNGQLTARVVGALWWDRDQGAEQIDALVGQREALSYGRFRAHSVKLMLDGVAETGTAALLEPYLNKCGCATANRGSSFIDPAELPKYVTELDRRGFQCHFHALGDRAVRDALDALDSARQANGRNDTRPQLAHVQIVHPDDIPRFSALGAMANIQPLWAAHEPQMDDLTIPFLGEERTRLQYPFASLLRSGASISAGSDWPVSSANPLEGIHVAVNRVLPGVDAPIFLPNERLSLADAITAYTIGSARANHLDDTGRIQVGALADLVVLDRDPFDHPSEEIAETTVDMTFVGGERVYARRG